MDQNDLNNMSPEAYNDYIQDMREREYPMLRDSLYLDHAGTTLYSKTLMDRFHVDMMANMYGNPHSTSTSSQRSTHEIENARLQALRYFGADPEYFDLVFTANATAALKLVMEAFREQAGGFRYGYHVHSHTSLVGIREAAKEYRCLTSEREVEAWLSDTSAKHSNDFRLFAYPAQSNMNGSRLSLDRTKSLTPSHGSPVYVLLDAAAYAATSPLLLDNLDNAPDFTVLSFSKIFGFPDLGGLIVRKDAAHLFESRKYFGGGTVDMVVCLQEQWHEPKVGPLHARLEDGTLPVHSIVALKSAMCSHNELFGSLDKVATHVSTLAAQLFRSLSALRHFNGKPVCKIYKSGQATYGDQGTQGPAMAFNLLDSQSQWISNSEVEKLAVVKDIHLRTGGVCNPGGVASCLELAPWQMRENLSAGFRCGSDNDIVNGKPTGIIRVSLGATSTTADIDRFTAFVEEFFVEGTELQPGPPSPLLVEDTEVSRFHIESLTVYPIKSCAGWRVPYNTVWDVCPEGLAWDREWCLVNKSTGAALSQKGHPRMALIRPELDLAEGVLRVKMAGSDESIVVPLSKDPSWSTTTDYTDTNATVCGDNIKARLYISKEIEDFFTRAIGVPCTLARFPAASRSSPASRHSKAHLQSRNKPAHNVTPLLLSNESPILTISRSSLNRLNESIKAKGGTAANAADFRANIVLAESPFLPPGHEQPWAEDTWKGMHINGAKFEFLGGCRRCQMVCIDQRSGEKNLEPFVTLAKTRRFNGRVLFGVHTSLELSSNARSAAIRAGDMVQTWS